jgi:two-component system OmpR family sensor kinase
MNSWSLRGQLALRLGVGLGILWLSGAAVATAVAWHETTEGLDSSLQETAERLLPLALETIERKAMQVSSPTGEVGYQPAGREEYLLYQVRTARGDMLLRSHDAPSRSLSDDFQPGFEDNNGYRIFTQKVIGKDIYIQVAERLDHRNKALLETTSALFLPLFGLVPFAWIVVALAVGKIDGLLRSLSKEIHERGGSNLSVIESKALPLELQPMVTDVNRLLARLERVLQAERSFTTNSSHELRTPVAAALAQAQLLEQELTDKRARHRTDKVIDALQRLDRLVEKLLQLSRTESASRLNSEPIDLVEAAKFIVTEYRQRKGLANRVWLEVAGDARQTVQADIDAVGIAVANLIDNGLVHGKLGGRVVVRVGPELSISVISEGEVVMDDVLRNLPGRFVKGSAATEGAGLGLSIVQSIMSQMGGALQLFSPPRQDAGAFEASLVWYSRQVLDETTRNEPGRQGAATA